jgi:hypothetical protein
MIIGLIGLASSGKDSIANFLEENHQFSKVSFAGALKDTLASVFSWDRQLLEGITDESRKWREEPDQWWSTRLGRAITPRKMLQEWGTDVCRNCFHTEIWVASIERKLQTVSGHVVVTDCRFVNEADSIKSVGGIIVKVRRPPDPEWISLAESVNAGEYRNMRWATSKYKLEQQKIHESEWALIGYPIQYTITNGGTLSELQDQISNLLRVIQAANQGPT